MFDSNWENIDGETAHQIEILNIQNQLRLIEAFTLLFSYTKINALNPEGIFPSVDVMKELHRAATLILLNEPGEIRKTEVVVRFANGAIVHSPPTAATIPDLLNDFHKTLQRYWNSNDALLSAAYALWAINFIHPFVNGNGRTARAFAYTCICIKADQFLPGTPTIIDQLVVRREELNLLLNDADRSFSDTGIANLAPIQNLLYECLKIQLDSSAN